MAARAVCTVLVSAMFGTAPHAGAVTITASVTATSGYHAQGTKSSFDVIVANSDDVNCIYLTS